MIRLPVMDLPAQYRALPGCGMPTATMLIPGTIVTFPLFGSLVIVTDVASGLHCAFQERSSTSSDSMPEAAERVSLISWASAPVPMDKDPSSALAAMNLRRAISADSCIMAIINWPVLARRRACSRSKLDIAKSFDQMRQRAGSFQAAVVVMPLDAAAIR